MAKIAAVLSSVWNGVTLVAAIAIWAGMALGPTVPLIWLVIKIVAADQVLLRITCVATCGIVLAVLWLGAAAVARGVDAGR